MDESFPPARRFHHNGDFGRVMRRQQKAAGPHVVVLLAPRHDGPRLGVMVSTKINKRAVRRHQLKRWCRELFRRELQHELGATDLLVLFRRDPPADGHAVLAEEIRSLLPRAREATPKPRKGGRRRPRR